MVPSSSSGRVVAPINDNGSCTYVSLPKALIELSKQISLSYIRQSGVGAVICSHLLYAHIHKNGTSHTIPICFDCLHFLHLQHPCVNISIYTKIGMKQLAGKEPSTYNSIQNISLNAINHTPTRHQSIHNCTIEPYKLVAINQYTTN